jgi:chromosome segregation ATPase
VTALLTALEVTSSTLLAPTGGLGIVAGLLAYAAKQYKEGRLIDVDAAKRRAEEAEQRESGTETELRQDVLDLKEEVEELRKELRNVNKAREDEFRTLRTEHADQVRSLDRVIEGLRRQNSLLRVALADRNIPLPEGVEP